ncbi:phosphoribosylformylglycinamidine cyclo-ligase [Helicobacter cetorum]|uniref:phosphoribosylformylglycinamidine cyclo-ligase n=1 Tax=Helicobacter cetorum TaxID=138563 RepID=UPI000CF150A5|nr:phosphoribosylformylglycinamidine cyclo-ligase [Helicobacter cetorum]
MAYKTYKQAGVDIDEGNALVEWIKPLAQSTFNTQVLGGIGGFAGAFKLPKGYEEPVLLACADGVGTKLRLAIETRRFNTIGIDLVAMCVNDLLCHFAKPLFFLDYYASAKLIKEEAIEVVRGITQGCLMTNIAFLGGESAEMPGFYTHKDFDLAGFAVGICEEKDLECPKTLKEGDVLVGLKSSGLHSNGYALAYKILLEDLNFKYHTMLGDKPLIDVLLEPTRIYVAEIESVKKHLKALAHITGGGLLENVARILPKHLSAVIHKQALNFAEIFAILKEQVGEKEAFRVFNMGIGMVLIVGKEALLEVLETLGNHACVIGTLELKNTQNFVVLR